MPLAESGLKAKAVSRAGAAGYWQLMPGTARNLGLKVSGRIDERFNVLKATDAACRYLRALYTQLGSWSLVAAAYNAGPGYMKNQLQRQAHRDYYRMSLPAKPAIICTAFWYIKRFCRALTTIRRFCLQRRFYRRLIRPGHALRYARQPNRPEILNTDTGPNVLNFRAGVYLLPK
ncbi:lytic transglycosylase domain-containing protein [Spirosoma sp. KNUC1025]|uniref:lytic transglycosylase domain-containing protein n=1 Tax=Spirosoma sp. KNUC1025 TaxID=2894082 RepID=UPI003870D52C|nr:lytic transglycosylase domain-containing protein [Spirosoma sp. KNUC1025]